MQMAGQMYAAKMSVMDYIQKDVLFRMRFAITSSVKFHLVSPHLYVGQLVLIDSHHLQVLPRWKLEKKRHKDCSFYKFESMPPWLC